VDKVLRVVVSVRGERDFPMHEIKLPDILIGDLPVLVEAMQKIRPEATPDDAVRAIWRFGSKSLRDTLAHPMRAAGLLRNLPGLVTNVPAVDLSKVPKSDPEPGGSAGSGTGAGGSLDGATGGGEGGQGANGQAPAHPADSSGPFAK